MDIYKAALRVFLLDSHHWVLGVIGILHYLESKPTREFFWRLDVELVQVCSFLLVYILELERLSQDNTFAIAIVRLQVPNRHLQFLHVRLEQIWSRKV